MSCYPNGFITIKKLETMIDNPKNWVVFAKNIITDERFDIKDRNDLREYVFYNDYKIGYDFIGDWNDYNEPNKDEILFNKKYGDIEIKVIKKDDKISAEILKWENNNPYAEDTPSCFVLAYWDKNNNLIFVGDRFFEYVSWWRLPSVYFNIKKVQKILDDLGE